MLLSYQYRYTLLPMLLSPGISSKYPIVRTRCEKGCSFGVITSSPNHVLSISILLLSTSKPRPPKRTASTFHLVVFTCHPGVCKCVSEKKTTGCSHHQMIHLHLCALFESDILHSPPLLPPRSPRKVLQLLLLKRRKQSLVYCRWCVCFWCREPCDSFKAQPLARSHRSALVFLRGPRRDVSLVSARCNRTHAPLVQMLLSPMFRCVLSFMVIRRITTGFYLNTHTHIFF